ncbi:protein MICRORCHIDIA 4-like [Rhododendron vialii]|uniref:protein MICRORCHIDIA 4-like n=1 Tax=Rhododendron vialii TaxID=182163 RepID=UPI0026601B13|nr:protein MICRORCHIDIA 4-like [Rhododendron vialii]
MELTFCAVSLCCVASSSPQVAEAAGDPNPEIVDAQRNGQRTIGGSGGQQTERWISQSTKLDEDGCPKVVFSENQDLYDDMREQDWLKEKEVPRLKKENCQLIERLKSVEEILICDLQEENRQLKERLKQMGEDIIGDLQRDTQKLEEASRKIEEMNKVGENLRDILSEERKRQDIKKENLRTKLKDDASNTINGLFGKVTQLEQTVFSDLHNEKDRCKSLETKLDKALRENEQMDKALRENEQKDEMLDMALRQNERMNEELNRLR